MGVLWGSISTQNIYCTFLQTRYLLNVLVPHENVTVTINCFSTKSVPGCAFIALQYLPVLLIITCIRKYLPAVVCQAVYGTVIPILVGLEQALFLSTNASTKWGTILCQYSPSMEDCFLYYSQFF